MRTHTVPGSGWIRLGFLGLLACSVLTLGTGCARFSAARERDLVAARQFALQGTEALSRGRFDLAEKQLAQAVEIHPGDDSTRQLYAEALWNGGHQDQAVSQLEEALRQSGGDPQILVRLGRMRLAMGALDEAEHCADWALRVNRSLASARRLKGDIHRHHGRLVAALEQYHRALSLQEDAATELAVAEIYHDQQRPHRSLATLQSLAGRFPPDEVPARVHLLQGLAMKSLGRFDDAVERLKLAVLRDSGQPELLFHLAEAQWLNGDPGNARLAAERGLELAPNHQPLRQLLSKLHNSDNRMARAESRPTDR